MENDIIVELAIDNLFDCNLMELIFFYERVPFRRIFSALRVWTSNEMILEEISTLNIVLQLKLQ